MIACRTCLSRHDLSPLFGGPSVQKFSSEQLLLATGVEIAPNDGLPQSACRTCLKRIKKILDFRDFSSKVNKMLQEITIKPVIKTETDTFNNSLNIVNSINITSQNVMPLIHVKDCFPVSSITIRPIPNFKEHNIDVKPIFAEEINIEYNRSDDDTNVNDVMDENDDMDVNDDMTNDNHDHADRDLSNEEQNISLNSDDTKPLVEYMKKVSTNIKNLLHMNQKLNRYKSSFRNISNKFYEIQRRSDAAKKKINNTINDRKVNMKPKRRFCNIQGNIKGVSAGDKALGRVSALTMEDILSKEELDTILDDTKAMSESSGRDHYKTYFNKMEKPYVERPRKITKLINEMEERNKKLLALAGPEKDGTIECKQCSKVVRTINFKNHAKTHFEPQFSCEICGKSFFGRSHVNYHQQRRHGKEKRLQCPHCPFRAVDSFCIRNHVRAEHTGERPYVCDVCGASFRMRNNIVQHMLSHFGVRNVQCELCPALFTRRSQLWSHQMRSHFIDYTYHCYLCPETYKRPKPVRNHLLNIHGVPVDQQLKIKCVKTKKPEAPSSNSVGTVSFIAEATNNTT